LSRETGLPLDVVDLQNLGLDTVEVKGSTLSLGATVTLQQLLETSDIPEALGKAIRHEATYNLRQVATVAGALVSGDGRSAFAAAMLALDAQLTIIGMMMLPGDETKGLGDLLPLREELLKGRLITVVEIPLNAKLCYEYVARSPADLPVVAVAVAQWPSGRTRVVLGGTGAQPVMAMDGAYDEDQAQAAVENALFSSDDPWASAAYRIDVAQTLARRCLSAFEYRFI
jgi:CO/xanthine dehydrogenase FAD-binding subunit